MEKTETSGSLRKHPQMAAIFKAAESRFMTEQELDEYHRVFPNHLYRVSAARDVAAYEQSVVQSVINEIFLMYPYEQNHNLANAKCSRDVRYVVTYATLAMLMNDPDWFRDKLLIWMKTILQSFEFPERQTQKKKLLFGDAKDGGEVKLKSHQMSIYDTYSKLSLTYQRVLNNTSYELMEPYFQMATDVLSGD